jgi:hypothetical protein
MKIRIGIFQRGGKGYSVYYGARAFYAPTLKEADKKVSILAKMAKSKGYTPTFSGIAKPAWKASKPKRKANLFGMPF